MNKEKKEYFLKICWLYPELMSTYGDRGNIIILKKRCSDRNIGIKITHLDFTVSEKELTGSDMIIAGGAQDRQQEIVCNDLRKNKKRFLQRLIDKGIPGLFVCGSPQLLGEYYITGDGRKLTGLAIFDFVTRHFGHDRPRCIGNTVGRISSMFKVQCSMFKNTIVGFENHGGRTYLGDRCKPFARVLKGYGNNGEDGTEGALYKNVIACYYHGPFLAKNPHIADWLILKALELKYGRKIRLKALDDTLEWKAHDFMLKKMGL